MKQLLSITMLVLLLAGCAAPDPDTDKVALRAQQTIQSSFATVDSFLKYESTHPVPPNIASAATALRTGFPPAHRGALDALDAYKANRDTTTTSALDKWLKTLIDLAAIAFSSQAQLAKP